MQIGAVAYEVIERRLAWRRATRQSLALGVAILGALLETAPIE